MAAAHDAPSISSVLYESFVRYRPCYTREAFAVTAPPSDRILERMDEGPMWVALCGDVIVGTVSAVCESDAVYVRGLAVLPSARGQRIGALLLAHVDEYASVLGYGRLVLSTTPFLTGAIDLYERSGFLRNSEGPHGLLGTPLFTMAKVLESSLPPRNNETAGKQGRRDR